MGEILILFAAIVFCALGMAVSRSLKIAAQEAQRLGTQLQEEARRMQAEFDLALEQAQRALQKPQSNVVERVTYRMEVKGQ
jgi:hypothetical protein